MNYSEIGKMVLDEWEKSFTLRTELFCDTFVIMPNHIHGLLRIDNCVKTSDCRDARPCVSTERTPIFTKTNYGVAIRKPKSISSFVAGFKSAVTTEARKTNRAFGWQPCFHDHIIRNDTEYQRIFNYISNYSKNWDIDKFNPKNSE
jgi:REP element-mobilizing transposase RayT